MGNHKEWRKLARKARRKSIRQQNAKQRHLEEEAAQLLRAESPTYKGWLIEQEQLEEYQQQEEARLQSEAHLKWLHDEEVAQKQWKELQLKLDAVREERAQQSARIREEWEREQKKLKELKEKQEKEEEEKLKKEEELRKQINDFIVNGGNVPKGLQISLETNPLKPKCPFFSKTGACRFNDTCTRNHIRPGVSRILLIPNFYTHYSLQQTESEYGNDSNLEFEISETYEHFKEFFYDVLPEMEKHGTIRQFKVCCNQHIHLRGNLYVEYSSLRETVIAYQKFRGRWYGGKQLHVEFCNIDSWKSAICGLAAKKKCPKGSACNFLHVFSNPGGLFNKADRDLHRTPPPEEHVSSDTEDRRNWRWSESPENFSYKYHSKDRNRRKAKRKRSASPKRTTSRHRKEYRRSPSKEKHKKRKKSDGELKEKQKLLEKQHKL